jgi:hypothetical protein
MVPFTMIVLWSLQPRLSSDLRSETSLLITVWMEP